MPSRLGLIVLLAGSTLLACDGPSAASLVEGELLCPDFQLGAARAKMQGGLRQPIQMKVLNGKTVVAQLVLLGQPTAASEPTRFLLPDGNNEYDVEWAQCPNERATSPVDPSASAPGGPGARKKGVGTTYVCGETKPYKSEKLVTKRGDASTRKVTVPPPPVAACWTDETPDPVTSAAPSASVAPATPSAAPDPSAAVPSATASAAAAPSASAAPAMPSARVSK